MKVAELEGALLDYWVARALGYASREDVPSNLTGEWSEGGFKNDWTPSTDWAQGGPIIERANITLLDPMLCNSGLWEAFMGAFLDVRSSDILGMVAQGAGPTPLIAAMRAYVASKFGEEVPDIEKPL